jgi:6-phosphogluconolactonase
MRAFDRWLTLAVFCSVCALAGCSNKGSASVGPSNPIIPPPTTPVPIPTTAKAKFAYTGNEGASISGYSVDTSTGVLTALSGFPLIVGASPITVAVDPQNRFLFVADVALDELHVFNIDNSTGALSEISGSPFATVHEPIAIAVDPSGTHVYVGALGSYSVGGFNLSSIGTLTPIVGSPFATPGTQPGAEDVVVNAAGTFLYLQDSINIYTYGVNASSGSLTLLQTIAGPLDLGGIALDPHGTYLYAVGPGTNSILTYSINATTGLLTSAGSSPMVEKNGAYTISISPTGQFAYTIENNNDLVPYVLSKGVFTPAGNVYPQVYGESIGIDPSGSFVYVPQACSNCPSDVYNVVNEFSIGATGALTKIAGDPVKAGVTPWGITFTTQ